MCLRVCVVPIIVWHSVFISLDILYYIVCCVAAPNTCPKIPCNRARLSNCRKGDRQLTILSVRMKQVVIYRSRKAFRAGLDMLQFASHAAFLTSIKLNQNSFNK